MINEYKPVDRKKNDRRNERLSVGHGVGSVQTGILGRYECCEGIENYCQFLLYKSLVFF